MAKINAADYEAAIVMGFYKIQGKELDSKTGISAAVQKKLLNTPEVLEAGHRIAEACIAQFSDLRSAQAQQTGASSAGTTDFWKGFGAKDNTPKTDILVGSKRFSLKIGAAQLMSGSKAEALATFVAALEKTQTELEKDKKLQEVYNLIENFSGSRVTHDKVGKVLAQGTDKVLSEFDAIHQKAKVKLREAIVENDKFAIEFAREAMSGFRKFGESSEAAAEYMLVCSKDGRTVSIHSVYDDKYCAKIASRMRMDCAFKSGSVSRGGEKTGEYRYFSTVRVGVDGLQEALGELTGELVEFKVISKALSGFKRWIGSVWNRAIAYAKQSVKNTIKFLELTPVVKVNTTIKFD